MSLELDLETLQNQKGIGSIILKPDSPELIEDVKIQPFTLYPDDRGYFMEIHRLRQGLAAHFPVESTQISAALSMPGTIKAFHLHRRQTDFWVPAQGMFQVALVDLRQGSPTYGKRNTMYAGELRTWQILIPPGVGHGYKVISREPAMLVYVTDQFYNPDDEGRVAYNDPRINYDWETQHK